MKTYKSGLLLNRFQTAKILLEHYNDDYLNSDNLNTYIRIHSSDFEEKIIKIRQKIGNLPNILPSQKAYSYIKEYSKIDNKLFTSLASAPSLAFHYLKKHPDLSIKELAKILHEQKGIDRGIWEAYATIIFEKLDENCILPPSIVWDGGTELSKLFECELHSENNFLEQKFIDYLAVNGNEIEKIHWRNFEKFCAEYFKRQGYEVVLGPGTNDGGVDIRAYKSKGNAPDILVQCKRYKEKNKISIETVKSFYTDVKFENAKHGLIATTSHIADGGKKVCEARNYNIKFAEKDNIKKWAKDLWTYNE